MDASPALKPTDLAASSEKPPAYVWKPQADFGPWLRELRERRGLSIRALAAETGLSFAKLQRLESGGRQRAPSSEMILGLAIYYGQPVEEVLERAGFRVDVPPDLKDALRCDESFMALVLHPKLRPIRMDDRFTDSFSRLQKAQWVDFARKLEAHLREGGAPVAELIKRRVA